MGASDQSGVVAPSSVVSSEIFNFMHERKFLVVDDEDFTRTVMVQSIKALGVPTVAQASDANDAVSMLIGGANRYDCILCDYEMPGRSGLWLLKQIRIGRTPARRATPFALLTSHADHALVHPAMELDITAFLRKPIDVKHLGERLYKGLHAPHELKPAHDYAAINVDNLKLEAPKVFATGVHTHIAGPNPDGAQLILVEDVSPGTEIVRALTDPVGNEIIPKGTKLTATLLQKLGDLANFENAYKRVWIAAPEDTTDTNSASDA